MTFDISVVGGGPAGLSMAAAAAREGLTVAVVDPALKPWPQTYGAFEDQLIELGLEDAIARRWPSPRVRTDNWSDVLPRPYALIDNDRLHARLMGELDARGVTAVEGWLDAIESADEHQTLVLSDGRQLSARVVVRATGARPTPEAAAQVAFGVVAELERVPWPEDEALWMDFSGPSADQPSFLYALPLGGRRVLLEETSLASAPPVPMEELERRLWARIDRMGLSVHEVLETERVHIPLAVPVARPHGAVLDVGALAGFAHPATGYSLVRSLRSAPSMAAALAEGLREGSPEQAVRRAHAAAWPTRLRATRALHLAGLQVLLSLDTERISGFFEAFFAMRPEHQAATLDPTGHPLDVARAMAAMFRGANSGVRSDLLFSALRAS